MNTADDILAHGEKLLRDMERREAEREENRKTHETIDVLVSVSPDGVKSYKTMRVKRGR
ncbi:hypothetical protein [Pelagibacterium sp.]|uniref:hypothetical protein n=1 Tax=Pelagibacterium sp. TaxID=1967288 RepID=UPI003BA9F975